MSNTALPQENGVTSPGYHNGVAAQENGVTGHSINNEVTAVNPGSTALTLGSAGQGDDLGVVPSVQSSASKLPADQYADAAQVYDAMLGSSEERTKKYRKWMTELLKTNNCRNILDASCGTGVDSIMLLEEGFNVVSTDASDQMLKFALRQRWARRKEPAFDNWVIEEGNWLTLVDDLKVVDTKPAQGFDAIICMGNSFGHVGLLDVETEGCKPVHQKMALSNFRDILKPGGILILDHRNYDQIFNLGRLPDNIVYYNVMALLKCTIQS